MLPNPACPSTTCVFLLLSTSTITMEAGTREVRVVWRLKFSVRRLINLSTTWLAGFDHHAYKSEQRREVIKRVSVFLKKIQNPKPLI